MSEAHDYEDFGGCEPCPKCNGDGTVDCYCCGDLCCCENYGEKTCGLCNGEGEVSQERAEKYLKRQREVHAAFQAGWTAAQSKKDTSNER